MRKIRKAAITVLIIVAAYGLLAKLDVLPSLKNIFCSQPIAIDETPILIKEIKSIGQLITYSSSDEVVADSVVVTKGSSFVNAFNQLSPLPVLPSADKELVLIGRGRILAGVNLMLLTDSSISLKSDTIRIYLPKAQIFDAVLNPSDFETFIEKGDWTNEEVILVKAKARRKMTEHALQQNILPKANTKAKTIMETFLHSMGYEHVFVF